MMVAPEYNPVTCKNCGTVTNYVNRAHECPATPRYHILTVYIPNIGKVTKNADPAYRKHAGSRALRFRRAYNFNFI